jgi:hypothetical protein
MGVLLVETKWYRPWLPAVQILVKTALRHFSATRSLPGPMGGMPDPIQSSLNSSSYPAVDGATEAENSGQVCLPAEHASAAPPGPALATPQAPAVTSLVARFSSPSGSHPPIAPSLNQALLDCKWELSNAALNLSGAVIAVGGLATAIIGGTRALVSVGVASSCIEHNEGEQVAEATRRQQAADCEQEGAVPLLKADGSVICAR